MDISNRAEKGSLSRLIGGGQGLSLSQQTRTEDLVGPSLWLPSAALGDLRGGSVPRREEGDPTVAASFDAHAEARAWVRRPTPFHGRAGSAEGGAGG